MIEIPAIDQNDYIVECEFDGNSYYVRMSWNSEGEFWVMSIEDYARTVLIAGVLVVPFAPLLVPFHHLALPPGEIYGVLMDDTRQQFLRSDFVDGSGHLVYVEAGEDATL